VDFSLCDILNYWTKLKPELEEIWNFKAIKKSF